MLRWSARLILFIACAGLAGAEVPPALTAGPGIPPLLYDALAKQAKNFDHWAYTETRIMSDNHGVNLPETVIRFDPSKPYAEQYLPLKIDGKPPTEHQLKEYRRKGEKRGEQFAKEEAEGKTPGTGLPRFRVVNSTASIDLAHATVASEAADSVTYEVPLRNDGHGTVPVEKFQLFVRVNHTSHAFENIALRVRSAFRVALVLKVKTGEANVDFSPVDKEHDPVVVALTGDVSATILYMKIGQSFDLKRTDFQRVKPYSERFGVKIGPLKALDF